MNIQDEAELQVIRVIVMTVLAHAQLSHGATTASVQNTLPKLRAIVDGILNVATTPSDNDVDA